LPRAILSQNIDVFETVKERVNINEAIELYTGTAPVKNQCRCFFHQDKSPSFRTYPPKSFYCFGCGAGGTAVDFVSRLFRLKPIEAAKKLAADFGIIIDDRPLTPDEVAKVKAVARQRELNRAFHRWAKRSYANLCQLRRCCFKAMETGEDFLEHPEYYNLMQYADHILDCLTGSEEDKKATLEMTINNQLGLAGRWMKSDRIY